MRLNSFIIVVAFLVLVAGFWNRNALPQSVELSPAVLAEPAQRAANEAPFEVSFDSVDYRVRPQFRYSLTGLVVSFRHHEGNSRMHRLSNDHLNMLDICVVWGPNADPELLRRLKFWNGIFTCNVSTRDQAAWEAFDIYALSNNHLISDDPFIRDRVRDVRVGDQVRIEGWLSSYAAGDGPERGTSTTRMDTGNGACETIFVSRFEIVQKGMNPWRLAMWISLLVLAITLAIHFLSPYRPYVGN